jgi:hypothetical protein
MEMITSYDDVLEENRLTELAADGQAGSVALGIPMWHSEIRDISESLRAAALTIRSIFAAQH